MARRAKRRSSGTGGASVSPVSVSAANAIAGTEFHLGDGRRIGFGESAEMPPETAALLERHNDRTPA
jgi:hypothetical protein